MAKLHVANAVFCVSETHVRLTCNAELAAVIHTQPVYAERQCIVRRPLRQTGALLKSTRPLIPRHDRPALGEILTF